MCFQKKSTLLTLLGDCLDPGKAEECAGEAATWVHIISMGESKYSAWIIYF